MSVALLDRRGSLAVGGWVDSLGTGAGRVHQPGDTSIWRRRGKGTVLRVPLLRVHGEDTSGLIVYRNALAQVLCLDVRVAAKGLGTGMNDRGQGRREGLEEQDDQSEPVQATPVYRKVALPSTVLGHYLMPSRRCWCSRTVRSGNCSRARWRSPGLLTPPPGLVHTPLAGFSSLVYLARGAGTPPWYFRQPLQPLR